MAVQFVRSEEFTQRYGSNPTHANLVTQLYQNILHRAPEKEGYEYWLGKLDSGQLTAPEVLNAFSQSQENVVAVAQLIGDHIESSYGGIFGS